MKRHLVSSALLVILFPIAASCAAGSVPVAIRLNQVGFDPVSAKRAIVATSATTPLAWSIADGRGKIVATGMTSVIGDDAASGDHVHRADFSMLSVPGTYRLSVGGATSRPITIAPHLYAPLKYAALNYFYQTRAGIAIEARYAGGPAWARAAGHPHEVAPCFQGKDERGNIWPACEGNANVTGGWYDAGDQGKYVVNGGIALWTLLNAYEINAAAHRSSPFADGRVKLPEAGNGVDDLLDEARWEMDFLLAMQVPAGRHQPLPVGAQSPVKLVFSDIDASGTTYQKVADRQWTGLPMRPADDPQPRLLYPPTTGATLNLAATGAQCARIWKTIDSAFSARCLTASERAYAAALRNPAVYATNSFTGSGGYGDAHLSDEFYWATAELFATTGNPAYGTALRRQPAFNAAMTEPNWGGVAALGTITLATVPTTLSGREVAAQRALVVAAADGFLAEEERSGYHIPFASLAYPWGSNSTILNRAMVLALAAHFTTDKRYRDGVVDAVDYVLGRNPLDRSYVSGFGANPMRHPHHRFWAPSLDRTLPGPPPGVLSGGPNSTAMTDEVARRMKGKCAPQRCWRDEPFAFTMNEVAINWNAPLFWVAAYLDSDG